MKTLVQIQSEIDAVVKEIAAARRTDQKLAKRLTAELGVLNTYKYYLETNPSEAGLQKQLTDLLRRLEINDQRFGSWCAQKVGGRNELLAQYNRECETSKLKAQVKTLKYLLGL